MCGFADVRNYGGKYVCKGCGMVMSPYWVIAIKAQGLRPPRDKGHQPLPANMDVAWRNMVGSLSNE